MFSQFYTCGSRKASNGVKKACVDTIKDVHPDYSHDEALEKFESLLKERYATDVFD